MLPDLRLVIVAVAVTILVVIKFGADLASMLSDPYIGAAEAPGRRHVSQHTLPENPNQRQFQSLAAARRADELHRLLDLPTGTVSTYGDGVREANRNVGGPYVGTNGPAHQAMRLPARDNSSDAVPHSARGPDVAAKLAMTASPSPAAPAAITGDQRDRLPTTGQASEPVASVPPSPPPPADDDITRVAVASPESADDEVTPSVTAVLRRVPLPRARTGIHAAAVHAGRARGVRPGPARRPIVRRPQPNPNANAETTNPFGQLFGLGTGSN
jgi:hypothetical protein